MKVTLSAFLEKIRYYKKVDNVFYSFTLALSPVKRCISLLIFPLLAKDAPTFNIFL